MIIIVICNSSIVLLYSSKSNTINISHETCHQETWPAAPTANMVLWLRASQVAEVTCSAMLQLLVPENENSQSECTPQNTAAGAVRGWHVQLAPFISLFCFRFNCKTTTNILSLFQSDLPKDKFHLGCSGKRPPTALSLLKCDAWMIWFGSHREPLPLKPRVGTGSQQSSQYPLSVFVFSSIDSANVLLTWLLCLLLHVTLMHPSEDLAFLYQIIRAGVNGEEGNNDSLQNVKLSDGYLWLIQQQISSKTDLFSPMMSLL